MTRSNRTPGRARAFTLVEVLMAVLILGIGLLSLGALLPVVVKQQREGADQTLGTLAAEQAQALLFSSRPGVDEVKQFGFDQTIPDPQRFTLTFGSFPQTQEITVPPPTGRLEDAIASALAQVVPGGSFLVELTNPAVSSTTTTRYLVSVRCSGSLAERRITQNIQFNPLTAGLTTLTASLAPPVLVAGKPGVGASLWNRWAATPGPSDAGDVIPGVPGTGTDTDAGLWLPVPVSTFGATRGSMVLGRVDSTVPGDPRVSIPMAERLFPLDAAGAREPQFAWDLAVRREGVGSNKLQAALFVRRLDGRIRLPRNVSLYESLTGSTLANIDDRRWPLSFNLKRCLPAQDGSFGVDNVYSTPVAVPVTFAPSTVGPEIRDRLVVQQSPSGMLKVPSGTQVTRAALAAMAAQPGQILVDNLGNVYTVRGLDDRPDVDTTQRAFTLRIEPPVPANVPATANNDPTSLRQILFTPQVPARVVFTVVNP